MINRRQFLKLTAAAGAGLVVPRSVLAGPHDHLKLKCVAGWPGWWRCQSVGAHFGYQWDNLDPGYGKIPHVKIGFDKPWTGEGAIRAAAASGSIMICNEMTLANLSPTVQANVLHRLFEVILDEKPDCYILGPNDLVWEPNSKWLGYHNIEAVANRYKQLYGHAPPFRGFGFHAYHYPGGAPLVNMIWWAVEEIQRVYGSGVDCQITETGSLMGEQAALDSMPLIQEGLGAGIAAWYWYVTREDPRCQIWDASWNLTRVGRAFRDM